MKGVVSLMAAFLAMIVPASAAPLVPALGGMCDSLEFLTDVVT